MRIVHLSPGTCEVFYCENCLRDLGLVDALRRMGHDAEGVPLYLPLTAEPPEVPERAPIFFGGIGVYLRERSRLFRWMPRTLGRLLDAPWLLRRVGRMTRMTGAQDLGEPTCSMLRGEEGHQAEELLRLVRWLSSGDRPDVVCLSNILLAGVARRIKAELGVPIACFLQDEDGFLDGLHEPHRQTAWDLVAERATDIDAFIAVSHSYRDAMCRRMGLPAERVHVIHNGIELGGYEPADAPPDPPAIGFLAPALPGKGLHILVDAFRIVRERVPGLRLLASGGEAAGSQPFLRELKGRIRAWGLEDEITFFPNFGRSRRQAFLRSLSVLSVPVKRPEAFGAYILEALAAGVPVVGPRLGGTSELVEATGGGILVEPDNVPALADGLAEIILHPEKARSLAERGRQAVMERFSVDRSAREIAALFEKLAAA